MLCRRALVWTVAAHMVPFYAFYALYFVDRGMSAQQVSALLAIWSAVGIVAEVPSGALADRFSRRRALAWSAWLQAIGYVVWVVQPNFVGFATGFAFWSIGGSLHSGTFEALVYDGLGATGEQHRYAGVIGSLQAAQLVTQIPTGLLATALFSAGGYQLVGWCSVASCALTGVYALRFADVRPPDDHAVEHEVGYMETLRSGVAAIGSDALVLRAAAAVALLLGLDALEEYFSVLVADEGTSRTWVPVVLLAMPLAGALGATSTRRIDLAHPRSIGCLMLAATCLLGVTSATDGAVAIVGLSAFYGIYRFALAVAEARLQHRITGPARATATSVAALLSELSGIAVFGLFALGGLPAVTVGIGLVALVVLGPLRAGLARSAGDAVEEAQRGP